MLSFSRLWACRRCEGRAELDALRQQTIDQALEREKALQAQIRDLQNKLTALADVRAQQASLRTPAAPQESVQRRSLTIPPYISSLTGGGHVNLQQARERLDKRRAGIGQGLPPAVR